MTGYRPQVAIELPPQWRDLSKWHKFAEGVIRDTLRLPDKGPEINVRFAERLQFMGYVSGKKKYLLIDCQSLRIKRAIVRRWGVRDPTRTPKPRPKLHARRVGYKWTFLTSAVNKRFEYVACNASCPPSVNFLRGIDAHMSGWVRVRRAQQINKDRRTWSKHYYAARYEDLQGMPKQRGIAMPSTLSFDLEVTSNGAFPKARRPGDKIIVCGTHFKDPVNDVDIFKSFVLNEAECKQPESEMLIEFGEYVRKVDPDVFLAYNSFGFDYPYIMDRLELVRWFTGADRTWTEVEEARDKQLKYEGLEKKYRFCTSESGRDGIAREMSYLVSGRTSSFKPQPKRIWSLVAGHTNSNGKFEPGYESEEEFERAKKYFSAEDPDLYDEFMMLLSRKKYVPARYRRKELTSSAMGSQVISFPSGTARVHLDLYIRMKTSQFALPDYKLKTVASHFLSDLTKIDLPIPVMNQYWRSGEPDKVKQVVDYCERDCELPTLLIEKLGTLLDLVEESRLTGVPVGQLVVSGQGIKTKTLLYRRGLEMGYFFNEVTKFPALDDFQGATVVEPEVGYYPTHVLCHGKSNDSLTTV